MIRHNRRYLDAFNTRGIVLIVFEFSVSHRVLRELRHYLRQIPHFDIAHFVTQVEETSPLLFPPLLIIPVVQKPGTPVKSLHVVFAVLENCIQQRRARFLIHLRVAFEQALAALVNLGVFAEFAFVSESYEGL